IDSNGCSGSDTVIIKMFPAPHLTITPENPVITCENGSVQLFVSGARKYIWQPGTLMDSNTSSHPIAMPPTSTTFYVMGSDGKGCEGYDSIRVVVLRDSAYMPNAFTPDGDGINDIIYPTPYCDFIFESFNVYNRYGNLMFSTTKYRDGWDGKFNGQPQPTDVYVYYITGYRIDRTPVLIKGNITLLR
ncbi:MAG: T9SS type B sorting domain-containing protein, partial [Flavipsychrobacter sp.]